MFFRILRLAVIRSNQPGLCEWMREVFKNEKTVEIVMPKSRGYRRKTRMVFRAKPASPLGSLLRRYEVGDRVVIDIDSRQTKGMPHRRFQGSVGEIFEVGRRSVTIMVPVGDKTKQVISRFEHLKPLAKPAS
jgi:large subunit ribosomal protein L21e